MDTSASTSRISNYNIASSFYSDVIKWRQNASKFWSFLIIFFFILLHSITANFDLFNNFTELFTDGRVSDLVGFILTIKNRVLFSYTLSSLLDIQHSRDWHLLDPFHILWPPVHSLKKLNYFYVIAFCGMSNFMNKFQQSFNSNYFFKWPIVEQTKYARFKAQVYPIFLDTFKMSICHLFIWQIFYYLIGHSFMNIFIGSNSSSSNEFSPLLSFLVAMKISFLINFANALSWSLYEIYLTQVFKICFFILNNLACIQPKSPLEISLATAMSLNSHPYIQTLAMIDYSDLSIYSEARRKQLFSLSFPNNQPINWTKSCNEALSTLVGFMEVFSFDDMLHGTGSSGKTEIISSKFSSNRLFPGVTSPIRDASASFTPIGSPLKQAQNVYDETNRLKSPREHSRKVSNLPNNSILAKVGQKLISKVKNQKIFSYIYNENTNYKTHQLFVDSFLITNVLRGLSNMAMASLREDEYGILQQTLADILTTFIQLQKVLEKFNPINTSTNISFKVLQKQNASEIELLMQKLTFVLNESIYKITITFGTSLKTLNLSDDIFKRLQRYYLTQ